MYCNIDESLALAVAAGRSYFSGFWADGAP